MKITCNHSSSSYGIPVILADGGEVMDYAPGIRAIRRAKAWSVAEMATVCGVSPRTVEGWEQGRPVPAAALNALAAAM